MIQVMHIYYLIELQGNPPSADESAMGAIIHIDYEIRTSCYPSVKADNGI
jgi:hypothetical protein